MLNGGNENKVWLAAIRQLTATIEQRRAAAYEVRSYTYFDEPIGPNGHGVQPHVKVLSRPRPGMAVISWCDPQRCRYGDQLWIARAAKRAQVCALTGWPVNRGDAIYAPRKTRHMLANADAVILASVIEAVPGDLEDF
jgi:Domain of unknown function (DUF3331)